MHALLPWHGGGRRVFFLLFFLSFIELVFESERGTRSSADIRTSSKKAEQETSPRLQEAPAGE